MQLPRTATRCLLRARAPLPSTAATAPTAALLRRRAAPFSTTAARAGGGESHYEPPSGWLWGVPPGTKPESEGWENIFIYGFCGSFVLLAVAYAFKPDTSIQTWALEEARRRLEKEGILPDPDAK